MMHFFTIFAACFSAILLFWSILQFLETKIPLIAIFGDKRYYYLCFFHAKALTMRLDGKDEKTILEELRKLNFPFFIFPNKNSLEDLSYVREVIQQDDLVKRFIFNREFNYSSFKKLIKEFNTPLEARKRAAQMALWDILMEPSDEHVDNAMKLLIKLLTPVFIGSDENLKLSPGENELNVYTAAKRAGVIREDCSLGTFAGCMQAIKQVHSDIQVVKGKQGLSKHADKSVNTSIIEAMIKEFDKTK